MLRAELFGHQTAQKIQLVRGRDGDEKIRRVHARLLLRGAGRAVSFHAENVQILRRLLQRRAAAVDDRYIVSFARKLLGQRAADLSVADDDDLHISNPPECKR